MEDMTKKPSNVDQYLSMAVALVVGGMFLTQGGNSFAQFSNSVNGITNSITNCVTEVWSSQEIINAVKPELDGSALIYDAGGNGLKVLNPLTNEATNVGVGTSTVPANSVYKISNNIVYWFDNSTRSVMSLNRSTGQSALVINVSNISGVLKTLKVKDSFLILAYENGRAYLFNLNTKAMVVFGNSSGDVDVMNGALVTASQTNPTSSWLLERYSPTIKRVFYVSANKDMVISNPVALNQEEVAFLLTNKIRNKADVVIYNVTSNNIRYITRDMENIQASPALKGFLSKSGEKLIWVNLTNNAIVSYKLNSLLPIVVVLAVTATTLNNTQVIDQVNGPIQSLSASDNAIAYQYAGAQSPFTVKLLHFLPPQMNITFDGVDNSKPVIENSNIVWMKGNAASIKSLYLYDLASGGSRLISTNQDYPMNAITINNNRIVWFDTVKNSLVMSRLDALNSRETLKTQASGTTGIKLQGDSLMYKQGAVIGGINLLDPAHPVRVITDMGNGSADLRVHQRESADIEGDKVLFVAKSGPGMLNDYTMLKQYDLNMGYTFSIANRLGVIVQPIYITEYKIAWLEKLNGKNEVFMKDINLPSIAQLTNSGVDKGSLLADGDLLIWKEKVDGKIVAFDLLTNRKRVIVNKSSINNFDLNVSNHKLVFNVTDAAGKEQVAVINIEDPIFMAVNAAIKRYVAAAQMNSVTSQVVQQALGEAWQALEVLPDYMREAAGNKVNGAIATVARSKISAYVQLRQNGATPTQLQAAENEMRAAVDAIVDPVLKAEVTQEMNRALIPNQFATQLGYIAYKGDTATLNYICSRQTTGTPYAVNYELVSNLTTNYGLRYFDSATNSLKDNWNANRKNMTYLKIPAGVTPTNTANFKLECSATPPVTAALPALTAAMSATKKLKAEVKK